MKLKKAEHTSSEKEKIINYCSEKFLKEGFYIITVDQIASELKVSKKTIYKHFSSKSELVEVVVSQLISQINGAVEVIINSDQDSLTKIIKLFELMSSFVVRFSEKWLKDLQIHAPKLWLQIDEFRTKRGFTVLENIIKQGQEEGIIIQKPIELMIHIFVVTIRSVVHPDFLFYQKLDHKEAFIHTFELLFNGILTPKGKTKFNKIFPKVIK
jgi:AcrR family transcriptional regulator